MKVNTGQVRGPKQALCIWVQLESAISVMVSCSGVYLVQILRIWEETTGWGHQHGPGLTASRGPRWGS